MQMQPPFDTMHVNLWGIPGTGKSGVAGELYGRLSKAGVLAELVREYAKELAWAGELAKKDGNGDLIEADQLMITGEQFRRENLVHGKVQVAITDAPVLAGTLYAAEEDESDLRSLVRRRSNGWLNLDVLLERDMGKSYQSLGRIQTVGESLAMRPRLEALIRVERPDCIRMSVDGAAERLADMICAQLNREYDRRTKRSPSVAP